jgi:hypothetical protein
MTQNVASSIVIPGNPVMVGGDPKSMNFNDPRMLASAGMMI